MQLIPPPYSPPPDEGLDLIFEDATLLVLNKPSGLLSVPGRGPDKADCLASRVQQRVPDALVVHRLDMETSGLFLMARGTQAQRQLAALFERRQVSKHYLAIVTGQPRPESGEICLPLITDWPNRPRQKIDPDNGKPSLTRYRISDYSAEMDTSRIVLEPHTGRSHQLRVHMQAIGHPILGDALYAPRLVRDMAPRLLLHAQHLAFVHPVTGQTCEFHSTPPF